MQRVVSLYMLSTRKSYQNPLSDKLPTVQRRPNIGRAASVDKSPTLNGLSMESHLDIISLYINQHLQPPVNP